MRKRSLGESISVICTIRNEERTIGSLLESLLQQTVKPNEVIIADAKSDDKTLKIAHKYVSRFAQIGIDLLILSVSGNRSFGRNRAIGKAKGPLIAVIDAGCVAEVDWLEKLAGGFATGSQNVDVVAGFYRPIADVSRPEDPLSPTQRAIAAYLCVMPDKFDPSNYLPSSRSVAFRKSAWEAVGGYPEDLSTCEDLVFAKKLAAGGCGRVAVKDAVVLWEQPKGIIAALKLMFSYAVGDGRAMYLRRQIWWLYGRYGLLILLVGVFLARGINTNLMMQVLGFCGGLYVGWAIAKNYQYVRHISALVTLPTLQIGADLIVMTGTAIGFGKRVLAMVAEEKTGMKATVAMMMARVLTMVTGLIGVALMIRALGLSQYGVFSLLQSIMIFSGTLVEMGLEGVLVRHLVLGRKVDFQRVVAVKHAGMVVFLTIGLMIMVWLYPGLWLVSGLLWLAQLATVVGLSIGVMSKAYGRFTEIAIANTVGGIVTLLGFWLVAKGSGGSIGLTGSDGSGGVEWFALSMAVGSGLTLLMLLRHEWENLGLFRLPKIDGLKSGFAHTAKDIWPFLLTAWISVAYLKIDMFLLARQFPAHMSADVGRYAAAYRPFELVVAVASMYPQTLYPRIVSLVQSQASTRMIGRMTLVFGLLGTVFVWMTAPWYVHFVAQGDAQVGWIISILGLSIVPTVVAGYFASIALAKHRERRFLWVSCVALVVNVGLNLIFIPDFSYMAAAWVTFITQLIMMVGCWLIARQGEGEHEK